MRYVVVDLSGSRPAEELAAYAAAQQRQLREHYAACFDGDGDQDVVRVAGPAAGLDLAYTADEFPIFLHPTAPAAEGGAALGEHRLDGCHVYLDLLAQAGQDWRPTASHEVLEARADRRLHACVELDDGTIWDREVCDRVEADSYLIDGVPLSNFNAPECFEPPPTPTPGVTKYDWMGLSSTPNEVRPGGYAQRFDPQDGWVQVGQMRAYRAELARRGLSRGARRARRRFDAAASKATGG